MFSEKEQKERGGALGHVLSVSDYEPGSEYIYYWGSAGAIWFEADIRLEQIFGRIRSEGT